MKQSGKDAKIQSKVGTKDIKKARKSLDKKKLSANEGDSPMVDDFKREDGLLLLFLKFVSICFLMLVLIVLIARILSVGQLSDIVLGPLNGWMVHRMGGGGKTIFMNRNNFQFWSSLI